MKRRRSFDVFSLSFLDCICCGFGAVILLFVIVNSRTEQPPLETASDVSMFIKPSQMRSPEEQKLIQDRVRLRIARTQREIRQLQDEQSTIEGQIAAATNQRQSMNERLESLQKATENRHDRTDGARIQVEELKADLQTLETEIKNLRTAIQSSNAKRRTHTVRAHVGDGYRHYLTGLSLSGKRTLILLDCSASMLSDRIVDVVRRRNLDSASRRQAPKWRQTLAAVDWLLTQLPVDGYYQIYGFNEIAFPLLKKSAGNWLAAADGEGLDDVTAVLRQLVPEKGTSLYHALKQISEMSPAPDNVVLMTDGLPTIAARPAILGTVSARRRLNLFNDAVRIIPGGVPINVILYQIEGDPEAATAYWRLAVASRGSYFCPSRDWP